MCFAAHGRKSKGDGKPRLKVCPVAQTNKERGSSREEQDLRTHVHANVWYSLLSERANSLYQEPKPTRPAQNTVKTLLIIAIRVQQQRSVLPPLRQKYGSRTNDGPLASPLTRCDIGSLKTVAPRIEPVVCFRVGSCVARRLRFMIRQRCFCSIVLEIGHTRSEVRVGAVHVLDILVGRVPYMCC